MKYRLTVLLGLIVAASQAWAGGVSIDKAWARATPPGATTAAIYLDLSTDVAADKLLGGSTDAARELQIHTHLHENGMMSMQQIDNLEIEGQVSLKPHGDHLMLVGLTKALKPGGSVRLTLNFERAGEVEVEVPVLDGRKRSAQ